ncbi:MAG: GNAT family N-acetyltransferase [Dorea sp.]|jgi:RimJ/RimL family protein N-acetyltransferase|nr:GNAT family N-acetyltransferase [Dorea sp.]
MILKKAEIKDFDFFYNIKCEEDNLFWCGYFTKPERGNLYAFWDKNITDNSLRDIYIATIDGESVGYAYIDYNSEAEIEISLGVSNKMSGKGYGTDIIRNLVEKYKETYRYIVAYVRKDNIRSQKAFFKAGFVRLDETKTVIDERENELALDKWQYNEG